MCVLEVSTAESTNIVHLWEAPRVWWSFLLWTPLCGRTILSSHTRQWQGYWPSLCYSPEDIFGEEGSGFSWLWWQTLHLSAMWITITVIMRLKDYWPLASDGKITFLWEHLRRMATEEKFGQKCILCRLTMHMALGRACGSLTPCPVSIFLSHCSLAFSQDDDIAHIYGKSVHFQVSCTWDLIWIWPINRIHSVMRTLLFLTFPCSSFLLSSGNLDVTVGH